MWTPTLWAGFSNDTARAVGPAVKLEPGKPAKIADSFGGKDGYLKAVRKLEEELYKVG